MRCLILGIFNFGTGSVVGMGETRSELQIFCGQISWKGESEEEKYFNRSWGNRFLLCGMI